jgi:hypothetical protein
MPCIVSLRCSRCRKEQQGVLKTATSVPEPKNRCWYAASSGLAPSRWVGTPSPLYPHIKSPLLLHFLRRPFISVMCSCLLPRFPPAGLPFRLAAPPPSSLVAQRHSPPIFAPPPPYNKKQRLQILHHQHITTTTLNSVRFLSHLMP